MRREAQVTNVPGDRLTEAARMLRAVLEALPPTTARDRATARRIEGAAVALDVGGQLVR